MAYAVGKRIVCPVTNLYLKKIEGIENIPKEGNFIAAMNHESYLDHPFLVCTILRVRNVQIHFLAKKEHFDNPLKAAWHRYTGAIPVDREAGGKEALEWAVHALKEGKIIALHPEGTRTLTGKMLRAKTGIARLALMANVPVLPMGIDGAFEILPKGKILPKCKRATLKIGKLMHFTEYKGKENDREALREITTKIMKEIALLASTEYPFD